MRQVLCGLTICMYLVTFSDVHGQTLGEANQQMRSKEYEEAVKTLMTVTTNEPSNGFAWSQLGAANYQLKRYDDAVRAYTKADELGFSQATTRYNIACALSLAHRNAEALDWLEKAVASGFAQVAMVESDEDIKPLRNDPRFQTILEGIDRNANPCRYDERRRVLDFWVGSWDVFNSQGQKIGTNTIEKRVGDCLLYETWTSALGGTGQSMNYLDPVSGKWKQNWVSRNGGTVWYEGEFNNGTMYFQGENIAPDGTRKLARVTLSPFEGRIRHLIETSSDQGKTWTVSFDGTYIRQSSK